MSDKINCDVLSPNFKVNETTEWKLVSVCEKDLSKLEICEPIAQGYSTCFAQGPLLQNDRSNFAYSICSAGCVSNTFNFLHSGDFLCTDLW